MPRYFRPKEAARYVGGSNSNLAKRRMLGLPPAYSKVGGRIIYDQEDLDEWIRSEKRLSTSDPRDAELRRSADAEEDAGDAGPLRPRRRQRSTASRDQGAREGELCPRPIVAAE